MHGMWLGVASRTDVKNHMYVEKRLDYMFKK